MNKEIFTNDVTVDIKRVCDNDFYDHYSTDFFENLDTAKSNTSEIAKETISFYADSENISINDFLVKTDEFGNIVAEFCEKNGTSITIEVDVRSYTLFSH